MIRRWREEIKGFSLSSVYFDEETAKWVEDRMAYLSRFIGAHSHSVEFHETPITVQLLEEEIGKFRGGLKTYKDRRKQWITDRERKKDVFS